MVRIHREAAKSDFLGIKNENWMAASCDLGAHALRLYLYFAANANNYELALSPVAVQDAIGMPRSTYHDQFRKLISKGYLVQSHGNTFDFYEVPQPSRAAHKKESWSSPVEIPDFPTDAGLGDTQENFDGATEDREINNRDNPINESINIGYPKVREIHITNPKREGKEEISAFRAPKHGAFEF